MKINKEKLYKLTSICLLIISIIVTFVFIKDHIYKWLNSDDASELILGKLLASENSLISKNWYYSTELRVLNTNIFYALIFKFTDNFYVVRMVSYILMWIILLLVYFGLCKALNIKKNMIISASLLFVPFSLDYYKFVLSTAYYIPHIVISFLTIMLSELYLKSNKKRYLIIGIILSIFAGLGGPRQLIVIYIPLFVASVVPILFKKDDDYNFLRYGLFVLIGSAIGYVLNTTILARIYHFETYGHLSFVDFSIDRFNSLIKGMFNCFGYTKGRVFSGSLITNITCAAWLFLNIYAISYSLKHKDERVGGAYIGCLLLQCGHI